jgi:hypothetical protein
MYIRRYDWEENDIDATVYLSPYLRVRVTDPDKNPLPHAKCRLAGDEETVYDCDENGVAKIPLKDGNQDTLDIEWEPGDAASAPVGGGADNAAADAEGSGAGDASGETAKRRFYWSSTFRTDIDSMDDEKCSQRLTHLGFCGESLEEQVKAYQNHYDQEPTGNLGDIRDELVKWHDGGTYPGQESTGTDGESGGAAQQAGSADPEQNAAGGQKDAGDNQEQASPDDFIEICLLDSDKKIITEANCKRVDGGDTETVYTTENADGKVKIPVQAGTKTIEIVWEPKDAANVENGPRYFFRQTLYLPSQGEDENTSMSNMLKNLGFEEESLTDQKITYQQFFNKTVSDSIDSIYSGWKEWVGSAFSNSATA